MTATEAVPHMQRVAITIATVGETAKPGDRVNLTNLKTGKKVLLSISETETPGSAAKATLEYAVGDTFDIPLKEGDVPHRFDSIERIIEVKSPE